MRGGKSEKNALILAAVLSSLFFLSALASCALADGGQGGWLRQNFARAEKREKITRGAGEAALLFVADVRQKKDAAAEAFISTLSETERLSQLFVINLEGSERFWFCETIEESAGVRQEKPRGQELQNIAALIPGGYIFFSFNINPDPEKIAAFTDSVRAFARDKKRLEPFLCLDAEGGYVNRLRGIAGELPENARVAACLGADEAHSLYSLNAVQLRSLGFDLNLSPVAEVETEANRNFLDGRSFGGTANVVRYGASAVRAYEENRVGAVLKHFPGNSGVDPHAALPRLKYTEKEFYDGVLHPFGALIKCGPSGILMSHAMTAVEGLSDGAEPAGLSGLFVQKILRSELAFDGIVFSDDIFMSALEQNGFPPEKAVERAVKAGVNCILMSEKRFINEFRLVQKLYHSDGEFRARADESVKKVIEFKAKKGILEYKFDGDELRLVPALRPLDSDSRRARMERFYGARAANHAFYEKYFMPTADQAELNAVRIK